MRRAIKAALPLVSRVSNETLTALIPPLPVPREGGWDNLRDIVKEDTVLLNFLRHMAARSQSPEQLSERIERFIVNPIVLGGQARRDAHKRHGIAGLGWISISPTVVCNLHCKLCYNLTDIHHTPKECLPREVMDKVMREGKALGAYRFTFVGGEPLIRWRDIHAMAVKHREAMVTIISNGLLLTDEIAEAFAALPNVEISFSVDGFEKSHDDFRGEGTYHKVLRAMERYRDAGGMLLYSPTVTADNYREVFSDEFVELMISKGCHMGYYHHYDMIGGQARSELLLTGDQLRWIDRRITEIVSDKPIAITDQVLSRLLRGGCAAVRDFIHVNHRGEVEPCCMVPFAADSVRDRPLAEIMQSPFFARIGAVESDEHGVKRCLMGENTGVIEDAIGDGLAFGTTKLSSDLFALPRDHGDRLHPTCFSAVITEDQATRAPRRRFRLPMLQ